MKRLSKKKKTLMLHLLHDYVDFVEWQEREGNIDGACDPSISVEAAKRLIKEFKPELLEEVYFLQV